MRASLQLVVLKKRMFLLLTACIVLRLQLIFLTNKFSQCNTDILVLLILSGNGWIFHALFAAKSCNLPANLLNREQQRLIQIPYDNSQEGQEQSDNTQGQEYTWKLIRHDCPIVHGNRHQDRATRQFLCGDSTAGYLQCSLPVDNRGIFSLGNQRRFLVVHQHFPQTIVGIHWIQFKVFVQIYHCTVVEAPIGVDQQ